MESLKQLLIALLVLSSLCACADASASRNESPEDAPTVTASRSFACENPQSDLSCLKKACEHARGQFAQDLMKCECPRESSFSYLGGQPTCVRQIIKNECLTKYQGFRNALNSQNHDETMGCLNFTADQTNGENLGQLYIDLEKSSIQDKTEFARWADSNFYNKFRFQFWTSPSSLGEYFLIGGQIENSLAIDGLIKPIDLPDESVDYLNFYYSPKYFLTALDATQFLSGTTTQSQINPLSFSFQPELSKLVEAYRNQITAGADYKIDSRYKEGCLRSCVAQSQSISISDGYKVIAVKYYLRGDLIRSELRLMNRAAQVIAAAILADRSLSILISFERDTNGVLKTATGYDISANRIFQRQGPNTSDLATELTDRENDPQRFDILVGLCEEGSSQKAFERVGLTKIIALGPHAATELSPGSGSFYGWMNPSDRPVDFWAGRLNLNIFGALDPSGSSSHAANTAHILSVSIRPPNSWPLKIGVAPLGITNCIAPTQTAKWWDNFKQNQGKVVNISASEEMDESVCRSSLKTHPMINEPNEALWVVAAGNQGVNAARGCPQHFAGRPNLIVVGANKADRMHERSNFGENLVDIVAPGETIDGSSWGTSFSTPRVSRLAAELFQKYPQLSPADIKLAILLGAQIPRTALPVRSKGILDPQSAEEIAKGLSHSLSEAQTIQTLMDRLFCPRGRPSCTLSKTKMTIYQNILNQGRN